MIYDIDITELWNGDFTYISTPDDYQKINSLVKKEDKLCYALLFDNGDIIECSGSHLVQRIDNSWISANDIVVGDEILTRLGCSVFLAKHDIGYHDVYDLEVDHDNHRYYSENIVSHNTGKSSTAKAIIKELGCEALFINASIDNGIDVLRGKIKKFASSASFDDKIKIVVLDEFDNFSKNGQDAFRGFIDEYSSNCRFIFTANHKEKIIDPLLERMEKYDFNNFSKEEMVKPIFERLKWILENENIQFDPKDLVPVINTYYPKIRSMVGTLQKFSNDGVFKVQENELDDMDAFNKIMKLHTPNTYTELIEDINKLNAPDSMYVFLYNNYSTYFKPNQIPKAIITIAKYQHMSESVRDKNLNLSACMTELLGV